MSRVRVEAADCPGSFTLAIRPTFFGAEIVGSGGVGGTVGGTVVFRIVFVARTPVPCGRHSSARAADGGPWFYLRLGRRVLLPA